MATIAQYFFLFPYFFENRERRRDARAGARPPYHLQFRQVVTHDNGVMPHRKPAERTIVFKHDGGRACGELAQEVGNPRLDLVGK